LSIFAYDTGLPQAIVDTVREPILVLDDDLRAVAASRSFYSKFKVDRQSVEGRLFSTLGDGQWDVTALADKLKAIAPEDGLLDGFEVALSFPGIGRRVLLLHARKMYYEHGNHATILIAFEDITDQRRDEQQRDVLLREKELLLEEMQHRVANSLQIIASILLLKARTINSEEVRNHLHDAHKRILAVAAVQKHLRATFNLEDIAMRPYLTQLCASLAGSMIGERTISIIPQIDDATEKSGNAVSIGLVVTELVINALKHAFPLEGPHSKVDVVYTNTAAGWRLTVSDNGVGKVATGPLTVRSGLGTNIVAALAEQLGARVFRRFSPTGMSVSIESQARVRDVAKNAGAVLTLEKTSSNDLRNRKKAEA
jgi:chemotaxis protein methyltransferase CheR